MRNRKQNCKSRRQQYLINHLDSKSERKHWIRTVQRQNVPDRHVRNISLNSSKIYILHNTHEMFYRIDHMLYHKNSLSKCKKIEFVPTIFSNNNSMKLELNNRKKTGKLTNVWRLNNILLNNQYVKKNSKRK